MSSQISILISHPKIKLVKEILYPKLRPIISFFSLSLAIILIIINQAHSLFLFKFYRNHFGLKSKKELGRPRCS
jgi:hypothetical protein